MSNNKGKSKKNNQEDLPPPPTEGFLLAAAELTLSEELKNDLPSSCRRWKPEHVKKWLVEVFPGAKDLPMYQQNFLDHSIDGPALLSANDKVLTKLGIDPDIHLPKIKLCIEQLVGYQKRIDKEEEEQRTHQQRDKVYFDLEKKYSSLISKNPNYKPPYTFKLWTDLDVFFHLKQHPDQDFAELFIRPIGLQKLGGTELLELVAKKDDSETTFLDLEYKSHKKDIQRFKKEIQQLNDRLEKFIKREIEDRLRKLQEGLAPLVSTNLSEKKLLVGSGSFAHVYLASYEKRKVALKKSVLKSSSAGGSANANANANAARDLLYEAAMLKRAACPGVIQLIAVDSDPQKPQMATEYMSRGSLEEELFSGYVGDNTDSIFHQSNIRNLMDNDDGIEDPVLFHIVRIARDVASALLRIHNAGILHLDLAARNIFLDAHKKPKIGDFGMAVLESDMLALYNQQTDPKGEYLLVNEVVKRKYKTKIRERPLKWMPESIVIEQDHPLFDRHVDVFSLGCVFYELITGSNPHSDLGDKDLDVLIQRKVDGQGNPPIPLETDPKFASLIKACWDMDSQEELSSIVDQLTNYHKELKEGGKSAHKIYSELKMKSESASEGNAIFLNLSTTSTTSSDPPKQNEFRITFKDLSSALASAMSYKDHFTILYCMKSLNITGSNETVVEAMVQCIDLVGKLAIDPHSSIDEGDAWNILCENIVLVVETCLEATLAPAQLKTILISSLSTISRLIEWNTDKISSISPLNDLQLFDFISKLFRQFLQDADIVRALVDLVKSISQISPEISNTLYGLSVVSLLLKCISLHTKETRTLISCIQTLGTFPLQQLLEPTPLSSSNRSELTSAVDPKVLLERWEQTFNTVFQIITNFCNERFPKEKESLLQTALLMLFHSCEDSIAQTELLERFFYSITEEMIRTLYAVIKQYPSTFRIQDGAIGILSHMIRTGMRELEVENVDQQYQDQYQEKYFSDGFQRPPKYFLKREKIPLRTHFEDRAKVVLQEDKDLKLIIAAMQKFRVDDQIAIEIKASEKFARNQGSALKQSAYSNSSSSVVKSNSSMSVASSNRSASIMKGPSRSVIKPLGMQLKRKQEVKRCLDEEGEELSAATLQKSVAIILGYVCDVGDEVQQQLIRTTYNELFLFAFKTFGRDVQLIQYGCYAIFSICRRNEAHQRILKELNILKYLRDAFDTHITDYHIADGIVTTFIGLLEPSVRSERELVIDKNCDSSLLADRITAKSHFALASDYFDFHEFTVQIASHMVKVECEHLTSNFLKLLGCFLYWRPNLLNIWWTPETFINSIIGDPGNKKPAKDTGIENLEGEFVDLRDLHYVMETLKAFDQEYNTALNTANNQLSKQVTSSNVVTDPSKSSNSKTIAEQAASSTHIKNIQLSKGTIEKLLVRIQSLKKCSLLDFIKLAMTNYETSIQVKASGLAIIVTMIRLRLLPNYKLGMDIDYKSNSYFWLYRYILKETVFSRCLYALQNKSDDRMLIRYSLWLLIIFISENPENARNSQVLTASTFTNIGSQYAAELATEGCVEWVMEALKVFKEFYSLQALCIVFLIWMDNHGRLSSRSIEQLSEISTLLNDIQQRFNDCNGDYDEFLAFYTPLEEECHDTCIMNYHFLFFGDIVFFSSQLLGRIEVHLNKGQPPKPAIMSPLPASNVSNISNISNINNSKKEAALENKPISLVWDKVNRPFKVEVNDQRLSDSVPVYIIHVTWEEEEKSVSNKIASPPTKPVGLVRKAEGTVTDSANIDSHSSDADNLTVTKGEKGDETKSRKVTNRWKLNKTYKEFREFQIKISAEFGDIAGVFTELIPMEYGVPVLRNSPEYNRELFNRWLQELFKIPGSYFNATVQEFLEISPKKKLPCYFSPRYEMIQNISAPVVQPAPKWATLPIQDMCYDDVAQLLFIASGRYRKTVLGTTKTRGKFQIFQVNNSEKAEDPTNKVIDYEKKGKIMSFQNICCVEYTESATNVCWDRARQILLVGLINGVIITYSLSSETSTFPWQFKLEYVGEFNFHASRLLYLSLNNVTEDKNYFVAASESGRFNLYNLQNNAVVSQTGATQDYTLTSFSFDFLNKIGFFGVNHGRIVISDCNSNPPAFRRIIGLSHTGDVNNLLFLHEKKTLLAGHLNGLYLLQAKDEKSSDFFIAHSIKLDGSSLIHSISCFQNENFIIISTNHANMLIYEFEKPSNNFTIDPTKKPAATPATANNKNTVAHGSFKVITTDKKPTKAGDDPLRTTAKDSTSWKDIIHEDNASIRKWLTDKGITSAIETTRAEYLRLVMQAEGISYPQLMKEIQKKLFPLPLFVQKVQPLIKNSISEKPKLCSVMVEEEQLLLMGSLTGLLYGYDLHEIFPYFSGANQASILTERQELRFRDAQEQEELLEAMKEDQYSTIGKKLQKDF